MKIVTIKKQTIIKKVLIISYFFPPSNFAGSYRVAAWAEFLHLFGYYPVIVTRHWEPGQSEFSGLSAERKIVVQKHENFEVHYLPYKGSMRDRLLAKGKFALLRRFLSLWELFFQNFLIAAVPYRNLYSYSRDYLGRTQDVSTIITSGKPFTLFRFGMMLKKRNPGLRWIADYRDPWNTHPFKNDGKINNRFSRYEAIFEKKWVRKADYITTVSDYWAENLSAFTGTKAKAVLNGYEEPVLKADSRNAMSGVFTIVHSGTLYSFQKIEILISAVKTLISSGKKNIRMIFPGILIDAAQGKRIETLFAGFENHFEISGRIAKEELLEVISSADLTVVCGRTDFPGCYPVKIFEYISLGKPVIQCPSDHGVVEELLQKARCGVSCDNEEQTLELLTHYYEQFQAGKPIADPIDNDIVQYYSRREQTRILAKTLDKLSETSG